MITDQNSAKYDRISRAVFNLAQRLIWLERWSAIILLSALVLTMSAQVIARYVFRSPFSWSEELARLMLIWLAFISASMVMAQSGHITVDLWSGRNVGRYSRKFLRYSDCLVSLIVVATCLLLLIGGFRFVWYVHPVGSPSLGIPKSIWYGAVSTGVGLMAVHSLLNLILQVRRPARDTRSEIRVGASSSLPMPNSLFGQSISTIELDPQHLDGQES